MTDKFVVSTNEIGEIIVTDVETDRVYRYDDPSNFFGLIRLLNEQQATIQSLQTELELISGEKLFSRRELERKVKEQQDTIFKLQDLCGESDSENAKLRMKSKELQEEIKLLKPTNIEQYEQIQKLQEENEQLKNRLNSDL